MEWLILLVIVLAVAVFFLKRGTPAAADTEHQYQLKGPLFSPAKHFDYLLCDRDTLVPRVAIELDDKSHRRKNTQARDQLLDAACASAGLRLLRFPAQSAYAPTDLANEITRALAPTPDQHSSQPVAPGNSDTAASPHSPGQGTPR